MKMAKFEVWESRIAPGKWYWHLLGGNGEIMCSSQAFPSKSNAVRACRNARAKSRFALVKVLD